MILNKARPRFLKHKEASGTRNLHIDALRGFALGAILLVNIEMYFRPNLAYGVPEPGSVDLFCRIIRSLFIEGKFLHLFSFLLGFGVSSQIQKLIRENINFYVAIRRRALFLFLLGLVHGIVLWPGDILFFYGAVCLFILYGCCLSERVHLFLVIVFFVIALCLGIFFSSNAPIPDPVALAHYFQSLDLKHLYVAKVLLFYRQQAGGLIWGWSILFQALLGALAQRRGIFGWRPLKIPKCLLIVAAGSTIAFTITNVGPLDLPPARTVLYLLSSTSVSLVYFGLFFHVKHSQLLVVLAKVGRRGLTVYLTQSVFLSLLGMSYTLPQLAQIPRWALILIAVSFFIAQCALYAVYDFRPLETMQKRIFSMCGRTPRTSSRRN